MSSGAQYQDRRIINWSEYNGALTDRGSLTFWLGEDLPELWFNRAPKAPGSRGLHRTFSDQAIQRCLTFKAVFHLAYRQTEGFVNSVFALGGIGLKAPDYTALAKRAKHLEVTIPVLARNEPVHVVVDSTGLKVYGEGEWKVRQHGIGKRRTWRKLHLAVDAERHEILGVQLTCLESADCGRLRRAGPRRWYPRAAGLRCGGLGIRATPRSRPAVPKDARLGSGPSVTTGAATPRPPCSAINRSSAPASPPGCQRPSSPRPTWVYLCSTA
jgi:hypothetical protein